jgi:predicted RNase H-like nuclease (RuvC/YqgF family)
MEPGKIAGKPESRRSGNPPDRPEPVQIDLEDYADKDKIKELEAENANLKTRLQGLNDELTQLAARWDQRRKEGEGDQGRIKELEAKVAFWEEQAMRLESGSGTRAKRLKNKAKKAGQDALKAWERKKEGA